MHDPICLSGRITLEPLRFAEPDHASRHAWNGMHRSDVALVATGGPWRWLIEVPPPAPTDSDDDSSDGRAVAAPAPIFIPTVEVAERHTVRIGRPARSLDEAKAEILADWERKVRQLGIQPDTAIQES